LKEIFSEQDIKDWFWHCIGASAKVNFAFQQHRGPQDTRRRRKKEEEEEKKEKGATRVTMKVRKMLKFRSSRRPRK
jgi:hypothetical protein